MNTVAHNEKEQAKRSGIPRTSSNLTAKSSIPGYSEIETDTTSEKEPDQDGDVDMSHADNKDVRSNKPGKPANDKDCADAS